MIVIGKNTPVRVKKIDLQKNIIVVDRKISWNAKDAISFQFSGRSPSIGAFEVKTSLKISPQQN